MNHILSNSFLALALIQADSQVYRRRGLRHIDGNKRVVNKSVIVDTQQRRLASSGMGIRKVSNDVSPPFFPCNTQRKGGGKDNDVHAKNDDDPCNLFGDETITPTSGPSYGPPTAPTKLLAEDETRVPISSPAPRSTNNPTTYKPMQIPTKGQNHTLTRRPTHIPTTTLTQGPTYAPAARPNHSPTREPTNIPIKRPTQGPTHAPTARPNHAPTRRPTHIPTKTPTQEPSDAPTARPNHAPTRGPTNIPTKTPTRGPTCAPTESQHNSPTRKPTNSPTKRPTQAPTGAPTESPPHPFTREPTNTPTKRPTQGTTGAPTDNPNNSTTRSPILDSRTTAEILYNAISNDVGENLYLAKFPGL